MSRFLHLPAACCLCAIFLLGPASARASFLPPVPVVTAPDDASVDQDGPYRLLVKATNDPASFSAEGLPDGLELDAASGLIQGEPTDPGVYPVVLRAANQWGTSTPVQYRLTVRKPAVVLWISTVPNTVTAGGGLAATYVFNRSTGNIQNDFVLTYTLRGSAVPGVDYRAVSGQVHFRPGDYLKTVKIVPLGNAGGPGQNRSVKFGTLAGSSRYRVEWFGSSKVKIEGQ